MKIDREMVKTSPMIPSTLFSTGVLSIKQELEIEPPKKTALLYFPFNTGCLIGIHISCFS